MAYRIHRRFGIPRKTHPQEIPLAKIAAMKHYRDGDEVFTHTCGTFLYSVGYGDAELVRCPACRILIQIKLPRCRYCGVCCANLETTYIHERYCTNTNPAYIVDTRKWNIPHGYHIIPCTECGIRHKENGTDVCPKCSGRKRRNQNTPLTNPRMKECWKDPVFRERVISAMKAAWVRGKRKSGENQQLDNIGASA